MMLGMNVRNEITLLVLGISTFIRGIFYIYTRNICTQTHSDVRSGHVMFFHDISGTNFIVLLLTGIRSAVSMTKCVSLFSKHHLSYDKNARIPAKKMLSGKIFQYHKNVPEM